MIIEGPREATSQRKQRRFASKLYNRLENVQDAMPNI